MNVRGWLSILLLMTGGAAVAAPAPAAESLEARIGRLERQLDNQVLVDMMTRLERLQQEVQQLRGQLEVQGHALDELKQRQRDLYLDIDRRLSRPVREGGGEPPAVPDTSNTTTVPPAVAPVGEPAGSTPLPVAPVVAASPATDGGEKERERYQAAFDLLRELRYEQAVVAFRSFITDYPDGRYSHVAQYWIGEAHYAQRNFTQAIAAYGELLQRYPRSPKLAEALLKIGYSHHELGAKAEAEKALNEVVQRYPGTTEASQATTFLQKMRQGGT